LKFRTSERTFRGNRQVSSNVESRTFVESTNISPGSISVVLFAQLSGSSGITAEAEGCPVIRIKGSVSSKWAANRTAVAVAVCVVTAKVLVILFICSRTLKTNYHLFIIQLSLLYAYSWVKILYHQD